MKSIFRQRVVVPVLVAVVGSFGPISSAVAQMVDHAEVMTRLDSLPRAAASVDRDHQRTIKLDNSTRATAGETSLADSILALTEPDTAEVLSAAESFLAAFSTA